MHNPFCWGFFGVNGPEILLSQQMTISGPNPSPKAQPLVADSQQVIFNDQVPKYAE